MHTEQLRILATIISLSLCACGGGAGGTSQPSTSPPSTSPPVTSGSTPNGVPAISALYPSCAPAGEQSFQLSVIGPYPTPLAYVVNDGCSGGAGGYVSMYRINPATGALASMGPPVWTYDENAGSMAVDPSGKFVYVTTPGDPWSPDYGSVAMYTINTTTGALTYMGSINGNCPGLCFPASVAVDPSGKFAYVTNSGSNDVSMYTLNATTGALTSIGTIATGTDPVAVAVDPSGRFAYVVNENYGSAGSASMYAINATTGALTSVGTIAAGTDPVSIAVDASGQFAYVANSGSNDVSMYAINSTTGSLTLTGVAATGASPTSIVIHPSGQFAYVTNSGSNDVSMYSIGSTGTLALIATIGT